MFGLSVLFVTCHLPAKGLNKAEGAQNRLNAVQHLQKYLGKQLGSKGFELYGQFHMVIWTGDFNYRLTNLTIEQCIEKLKKVLKKQYYKSESVSRVK